MIRPMDLLVEFDVADADMKHGSSLNDHVADGKIFKDGRSPDGARADTSRTRPVMVLTT